MPWANGPRFGSSGPRSRASVFSRDSGDSPASLDYAPHRTCGPGSFFVARDSLAAGSPHCYMAAFPHSRSDMRRIAILSLVCCSMIPGAVSAQGATLMSDGGQRFDIQANGSLSDGTSDSYD